MNDIMGEWIATQVHPYEDIYSEEMDEEGKKVFNQILKDFDGSKYQFNSDGTFKVTFQSSAILTKELEQSTNSSKWKFNDKDNSISIGNEINNYSILMINVIITEGKTLFYLSESPIILEVVKQN